MSDRSWQAPLDRLLDQSRSSSHEPRVAIVGVGNDLRRDDAAGMHVAHALLQYEPGAEAGRVLVVPAGPAPENAAGGLRIFRPDLVLLVDAADMGENAGAVRWIALDEIDGISASTHSLPLAMLARYLVLELGCEVALLGIQPASIDVGEGLAPPVRAAAEEVVAGLGEALFHNVAM